MGPEPGIRNSARCGGRGAYFGLELSMASPNTQATDREVRLYRLRAVLHLITCQLSLLTSFPLASNGKANYYASVDFRVIALEADKELRWAGPKG